MLRVVSQQRTVLNLFATREFAPERLSPRAEQVPLHVVCYGELVRERGLAGMTAVSQKPSATQHDDFIRDFGTAQIHQGSTSELQARSLFSGSIP